MKVLQSTVTSKGQITLPKQIRTQLSIRTGDRLEFSVEKGKEISVCKKWAPGSSAGCGQRYVAAGQKYVSVEEMDAGIRRAVAARHGRPESPGK